MKNVLLIGTGILGLAGVGFVIYTAFFDRAPKKNKAGSTTGSGSSTNTGSTTNTSTTGSGSSSNTTPAPNYSIRKWADIKVGDLLTADVATTLYYDQALTDLVTTRQPGEWLGTVLSKGASYCQVQNWSVPGEAETKFYIGIRNTYRIPKK